MTLDTNLRKKIYEGNGVKAPFPTVFVFNKAKEVYATHVDASGAETPLVLDTDFAVTGGSGAAGEVEFPLDGSAYPILPEGEKLVLYRKLTLFQELDIRNFNANDLELLEQAFDRLYMILQGHEEILSRCVQIQMSSTDDPAQIVASVFQAASQAAASALQAATSEGNAIAAQEAAELARDLAIAAAASTGLPDVGPLAGGEMLRLKNDKSGYEARTVAQVKTDLGVDTLEEETLTAARVAQAINCGGY